MKFAAECLSRKAALVLGAALCLIMASVAQASNPFPSPEIDPGSMGSALTLVIGGAFMLSRRTRRS